MGAPFRHSCRLAVATRDGRTFQHERLARRGSPEDAVGESQVVRKFDANVGAVLTQDEANTLPDLIMSMDRLDRIDEIVELLRRP